MKDYKEFKKKYKVLQEIVNDHRASTYEKLNTTYTSNCFTKVTLGDSVEIYTGKRFHLDNSVFLITENPWEDEDLFIQIKQ